MLGDDAFPVMNIPDVGSSPLSSVEELTRETNANGIVSRKVPKLSVDKDTNGGQRRSDRASRARRVLKSAPVPTLTSSPTIISTSPQGLTTSSTDEASAITLSDSSRLVERIDCKDDCESVRTDEVNVDVQNYTDVQLLESDLVNETAECGTIQTLKDTVSRAVSTSASITKSGGNKTSGESGRKPVSWTINENRLFFESLMKVGKDFEKLRVPTRSQEQLRHYYYRNLKMIHKWLGDEYKPRSGADERFQLKCLWYLQKTLNAPNDSLAASYNYTHLFGPRLVALYTVGKTEYSKLGKVKKLSCKRDKYYDINGLPIPRYTQCHHPEHTYISTHSGSSNTHSGKNTAVPCAGKQTKTYTTTENSVKTVRSGVSSTVNSTSRSKSVQSKPVSYLENGVNKNVGVENGTFLNRSESKLKSKSGSDGSEACARKMSASEGKDSRAKLPSDENVGATEGVSACERKSIPKFASNGSVGNAEGVTCGGNDGSLLSGPPATKTITSVPMPQTLLMRLGTKRKGNDRILPTRRPSRTVNTLSAIRAKKDVMEAKVGVPEKSFVAGEIHSLAPTLKTKRKISCVDDENDCKTTKKNMTLGGEPKKSNAKRVQKRKKKADVVPTFPVKPKPLMVRHMPYPYHKPVQPVGQILQAIGHAPPSGRVLPAEQILQHTGEISQSPGESLQPLTNTLENRQLQNITERTDSCLQAKANVILQSDKTTEQPSLPTRSSHATTITNPDVGTSGGHSDEEVSVGVTVEDRERGDDIYTLSKLDGMEQGVRMNADARESESVDMGATAGAMWNEASNGQNDKSKKFGMQLDTHHPHSSSNTDEAHRNWNIARASDTRTNMFDGRSSTLVNECENENYSMEEEILTAEEKRQLSITMRKLSNPAEAKILSIAMKKLSNRKNQRLLSIQSHAHTKACVNLCPNSPVLSPTHPHTGPMYQTEASKQALAGSTARQAQDVKYLGRTIDHQSNTFMPTQTMHKDIEFDYRTQTQPQPFPRSNTHSKEQTKTESSAFIISDSVIQPDLHLQLARQSSPSMADAHPKPHPLSHLNTNSEQVKRYGDMQTNDSPNQHPPAFTKKSHTFTNVQAPNNRVDTQTLEHAHSQTQSHSQKSTRSGPSSPTRGVPLEHRTRSFDALVNTALQLESVSMHVGSSGMQSVPPQQALEHSQTLHEKSHPRGVHLEPQVGPPRQNEYFLNVSSQAHSQRLEQSSHTSHIESAPLQPLKQPNDSQARSLLSESRNCSQQHSSLQRPSQLHDQSQSNGQLQQHEQSQPLHAPNPPTLQPLSQSQPDSQVQWLSGRRKRRVTPIPLNVNSNVDVSTSAVAGAGMALNQDMSMHDAYPLAQANAQTQLSHPHNNRNKQNPYKFEIHAHFDRTSTSTSPYNSLVGLAGGINMNLGTNMAMSRTNMPLRYDADGAHGSMESMAQNTREKEMTRSSSLDSNLGLVDNAVGRANESVGGRVNGGCDNADVGVALLSPLHLRSLPSDDTETDFNCTYSNAITGDTKQLASHTPLNTNDQAYINNYSGYSTDTSTSSYPIARTHPSSVKHKNINSSAGSGTNLHPHTSVNSNVNITNTAENRWSDSWSGPVRVDLVPACAQDRISLGRMNMNPNISINVKKGTKQVIKILDHLEKKWFGGFHNQTHNITLWVPFYTDNAPDAKLKHVSFSLRTCDTSATVQQVHSLLGHPSTVRIEYTLNDTPPTGVTPLSFSEVRAKLHTLVQTQPHLQNHIHPASQSYVSQMPSSHANYSYPSQSYTNTHTQSQLSSIHCGGNKRMHHSHHSAVDLGTTMNHQQQPVNTKESARAYREDTETTTHTHTQQSYSHDRHGQNIRRIQSYTCPSPRMHLNTSMHSQNSGSNTTIHADTKNEMKMDTEVSANTGVADNLNASAGSNDGMDENNVASSSKRRSGNFHLSKLQTEQQAHTYVKESVSKSIDNSINVGLNVDVHNQNKNELTNLQCSNMYKNVNMKRGMDMLDSDASGNPGYGLRFEHGAGTRTRTVTSEYVRSNVHNSKAIDDVKQLDAGDLFSEGNGLHMADDFVLPITNDRHQSVLVSSKSETSDISSLENKPTAAPKPVLKPPTPWDGDDTMGYSCDGFGSSVFLSGEGRGEQSNSTHLNARNSLAYNTCSRSNFNFPRSHTHAHPPSRTYSNSNLDAIRNLHDSSSIGPWQSQTRQDVSGKELRIMYERDVLDNADDVCMAVQMARNQGVSEGQADVHECDDPVECASASKSEPSSKGYTSTMVHNIGSSEYNVRDNARIAAGSPLSSSISASTGSKLMPEQIGERMVLDGDTSTSSAVYDISRTELGTKTNIGMIERHGNQITFTQPVRPTCSGNPEHTRA